MERYCLVYDHDSQLWRVLHLTWDEYHNSFDRYLSIVFLEREQAAKCQVVLQRLHGDPIQQVFISLLEDVSDGYCVSMWGAEDDAAN